MCPRGLISPGCRCHGARLSEIFEPGTGCNLGRHTVPRHEAISGDRGPMAGSNLGGRTIPHQEAISRAPADQVLEVGKAYNQRCLLIRRGRDQSLFLSIELSLLAIYSIYLVQLFLGPSDSDPLSQAHSLTLVEVIFFIHILAVRAVGIVFVALRPLVY